MTTPYRFLAVLLASLLMASSALAQTGSVQSVQHIVTPTDISATLADRAAGEDANRASIREALARPEVRQVATSMGADLARLDSVVATLSGVELERAASAARQVNQQLVGGASTVVISTTTLIIILLVVILLIVALK